MLCAQLFEFLEMLVRISFLRANPKYGKVGNREAKFPLPGILEKTLKENILGDKPYLLNPMFQTVQLLDISKPGSEPALGAPISENTQVLGGVFAKGMGAEKRKKYFEKLSNGAQHALDWLRAALCVPTNDGTALCTIE